MFMVSGALGSLGLSDYGVRFSVFKVFQALKVRKLETLRGLESSVRVSNTRSPETQTLTV